MTIAWVAGALRGGKIKGLKLFASAERERKGEGAPTTRPLFQPYFTFAKIVICHNYLYGNQGPNRMLWLDTINLCHLSTRNSCFSIYIQHSYKMGLEGLHDSLPPASSALANNFSPFPSPFRACHTGYFDQRHSKPSRDQGPSYAYSWLALLHRKWLK